MTEQGFTSHQTHYRSYGGPVFYEANCPTNSVKALKEDRSKGSGFNTIRSTHRAHNDTTTMQYETKKHKYTQTQINLCIVKWAQ